MGEFAGWHWLFLFLVLIGIPALVVQLISRGSRRGQRRDTAIRLRELAQLRDRGLIGVAEYERRRSELSPGS